MEVVGVAAIRLRGGGGYCNTKTTTAAMEIRWMSSSRSRRRRIPIYISTNPSDINPKDLRHLFTACNHSSYRFPTVSPNGALLEPPVDLDKLRLALSHSSVLVSVFCNPQFVLNDDDDGDRKEDEDEDDDEEEVASYSPPLVGLGDLLQRIVGPLPVVSPSNGRLVGFGRAVSDHGLTASIYDIMVTPSLRRMGIGKMIVKRIVRMLTNRDIYDIAAICSANERVFFEACGFGFDILGSTTMMYTKTASTDNEGDEMVKSAGRKLLLAPPLREPFECLKTIKS